MPTIEIAADPCECGNVPPYHAKDAHGSVLHDEASNCPTKCDGYACTYGCETCFCPCHD